MVTLAPLSRVRVSLAMAARAGHWCCSWSQPMSVDTTLVRVSMRPWPPSTSVWVLSATRSRDRRGTGDIGVQRALVALEGENIVAALFHHLFGDVALAVHRVGGDDGALERQHLQKLGHGGDLVRLAVDGQVGRGPAAGPPPKR